MNKPTTSRRPRRTRTAPTVQPVRIDEWKRTHKVKDFPGGITPEGATVHQFRKNVSRDFTAEAVDDFKAAGIKAGDLCTFREGQGRIGQILAIEYHGCEFVSKLLARDRAGNISFVGRTGRPAYLAKNQYKILGVLVAVSPPGKISLTLTLTE